jgi:predicted transcriptional regulator
MVKWDRGIRDMAFISSVDDEILPGRGNELMMEEKAVLAFVGLVHKKRREHLSPQELRTELKISPQRTSNILHELSRKGVVEKVEVQYCVRNPGGQYRESEVENGLEPKETDEGKHYWYRRLEKKTPVGVWRRRRSIENLAHMYPRIQKDLWKYNRHDIGVYKKSSGRPPNVVYRTSIDGRYSITFFDDEIKGVMALFFGLGKASRIWPKDRRDMLFQLLKEAMIDGPPGETRMPEDLRSVADFIEQTLKDISTQ